MPCPVGYVIDDNTDNMWNNTYYIDEYQNIGGNNIGGGGIPIYNPFVITNITEPGNYYIGLNANANCFVPPPTPSTVNANYFFFNWRTTATSNKGDGRNSSGQINWTYNIGVCSGAPDTMAGNDNVAGTYANRLNLAAVRCVQGH